LANGFTYWIGHRVRTQDDEAAVDGKRFQFDRESGTFFVWECGTDLGPFLLGLTVAVVRWGGFGLQCQHREGCAIAGMAE
jgi:hypothetical protein